MSLTTDMAEAIQDMSVAVLCLTGCGEEKWTDLWHSQQMGGGAYDVVDNAMDTHRQVSFRRTQRFRPVEGFLTRTDLNSLEHNVYMHGPDGYGAGAYGGGGGMFGSVMYQSNCA
jgi:hypothetical protein